MCYSGTKAISQNDSKTLVLHEEPEDIFDDY